MSKATVKQLFDNFGLKIFEHLKWGEKPSYNYGAVYVVSTADNPNRNLNGPEVPEFDEEAFENWKKNNPKVAIDNISQPANNQFILQLLSHWKQKENILYIGKASNLKKRIGDFYSHKIGKSSPHAGGQWIKALKDIDQLFIYCAKTDYPEVTEFKLLLKFAELLSGKPFEQIDNPGKYFPFANIKIDLYKEHGFTKNKN